MGVEKWNKNSEYFEPELEIDDNRRVCPKCGSTRIAHHPATRLEGWSTACREPDCDYEESEV
jgi:ribosomal protein S27AE